MNWKKKSKADGEVGCDHASANLSRFLDNDLSSAEATAIAAHIHGCLSCRQEFDGLRAQQALFSALPLPAGSRAARARVLKRLEASAAGNRQAGAPLRASSPRMSRRQFASVAALAFSAVIAVVGLRALPRSATPKAAVPIAVKPSIVSQQLPASDAITALFALHDRQSLAESKPAPVPNRPKVGFAKNRSRTRSRRRKAVPPMDDRFARIASKVSTDNLVLGQGSHGSMSAEYLASDDVPEAL